MDENIKRFYTSIKSRVTVAVVVKRISSATSFTFDYLAFLFLASLIALLGLIEDSAVVIVASMLVSPIMGPILAIIFGCVVADKELRNRGIRNALISLLLCIVIGFILGMIVISAEEWYNDEGDKFITKEMTMRGSLKDMPLDFVIAIASGAAAALSILGENTSSMVGVAISASLLPPAVNAGLLWAVVAVGDSELINRGINPEKQRIIGTIIEF